MKIKKLRNLLALALAVFFLTIFGALKTHEKLMEMSRIEAESKNLPASAANAIKHAHAASLTYSGFRSIAIGPETSEEITISLGKLMELAEDLVDAESRRDSTLEMMKDLNNNLVGIRSARWIEENESKMNGRTRINILGEIAANKGLYLAEDDVEVLESEKEKARVSHSTSAAFDWFMYNRPVITDEADQRLQGM